MISARQPILETTPQSSRESFHCEVVKGSGYGARWHFHPEVQLTLVMKSAGYRIVGDNIAPLVPGDLVFVGANLPHVWHQEEGNAECGMRNVESGARKKERTDAVHAIVVRFREDFLGDHFLQSPEMEAVRRLLKRSARGLQVTGVTREVVARSMQELADSQGLGRLLKLLEIVNALAASKHLHPIASANFSPELRDSDTPRMQRVMRYIHEHLDEVIEREEVARCAALSEGAFSRFFKTRTGKTLPQYINELRVGNACARLRDAEAKVADIALACGFENLANFNRQFRAITGMSPREYRGAFEDHAL
ncbi:transcriptional regulator, AraC family [Chthoniobacter flavus Ellin428]|uniref:Transcriptional regulator, AraC family n=1 Tax=Chthoniobacter flavus Ellin428 TaxID=497964 RepID=B4CY94_9BACT|nr:AraC family transcriptional regulator [Chthoniobacter flavus]EDY21242.1 transcriptional regulator, AraC family [Chthoniobacter flavus Ellin428]TCO87610.1 AraC-like DNA-binding protein [Chthoniobacter flavus]